MTQVGVLIMCAGLGLSLALMHVGLGIAVIGMLFGRARIHRLPGFWWLVAYAAWQLLSMGVSIADGGASLQGRRFGDAYIWISFYCAIVAFRAPRVRMVGVLIAAGVTIGSLALSCVQFTIGFGGRSPFRVSSEGYHGQSGGFFPIHLTQGFVMTQIGLLSLAQPLGGGWRSVLQVMGRTAAFLCVVLSNARTSFVGLIAALATWCGAAGGRHLLYATLVLLVGIVGAGSWLAKTRPDSLTGLNSLNDGRLVHWHVAAVLIAENPVFGVGGGQDFARENNRVLPILYPDGSQDRWLNAPDAHNSFLAIASEYGIPTLLFHLGFLFMVLRHVWQCRNTAPMAWKLGAALLVSAVSAGQFENLAGHSVTAYGFYVPLGFAVALTFPGRVKSEPPDQVPL